MTHFGFPRTFPRECAARRSKEGRVERYPKYSEHPEIPFWASNAESARLGEAPRALPRSSAPL